MFSGDWQHRNVKHTAAPQTLAHHAVNGCAINRHNYRCCLFGWFACYCIAIYKMRTFYRRIYSVVVVVVDFQIDGDVESVRSFHNILLVNNAPLDMNHHRADTGHYPFELHSFGDCRAHFVGNSERSIKNTVFSNLHFQTLTTHKFKLIINFCFLLRLHFFHSLESIFHICTTRTHAQWSSSSVH